MAKISFKNMAKYQEKIYALGRNAEGVIKAAVYDGADVFANTAKEAVQGLQSVSDNQYLASYQKREASYLSYKQKAGLVESMGLAPMRNEAGYVNTKLGFDGYNDIVSRRWPKGQPNAMIARSCNSGSTAMIKQPFMRSAVAKARKPAMKAMEETLDKEIEKIMK